MRNLLTLLLLLLLVNPAEAAPVCRGKTPVNYQPVESRYTTGLLFKVGKCGGPASFIFGTVHSDDPAITQTAAGAFAVLQHAAAAGFEYVEPANAEAISQKYLLLDPAGKQTLPDVIGEKEFALLAPRLQQLMGFEPEVSRRFKPWAAAVILQYPADVDDGVVLDMKLQREAKARKIPLFGLETMEEQFEIFDRIPLPLQIEMLKETLHDEEIEQMNAQLLAAYEREDLRAIQALSDDNFRQMKNKELANLLEDRVINQRNHQMAKRLQKELAQGKRLVAIGALHLLGKKGVLRLLEQKGYLVEPLSARGITPSVP